MAQASEVVLLSKTKMMMMMTKITEQSSMRINLNLFSDKDLDQSLHLLTFSLIVN